MARLFGVPRLGEYCETELGREKRCKRCRDWWPCTDEYYPKAPKNADGLAHECKACRAPRKTFICVGARGGSDEKRGD